MKIEPSNNLDVGATVTFEEQDQDVHEASLLLNFLESSNESKTVVFNRRTLNFVRKAVIDRLKLLGKKQA